MDLPNIQQLTASGGWCAPSYEIQGGPYIPPTLEEQRVQMAEKVIQMRNVMERIQERSAGLASRFYQGTDPKQTRPYLLAFDDLIDNLESALRDSEN